MEAADDAPPTAVADAFGTTGRPARLRGGNGGAWRAGDVVLKRAADASPEAVDAEASILMSIRDAGFRLQRPRRARDGSWIVSGWIARDYLEGSDATGRWEEILDAADALNAALRHVTRDQALPLIQRRRDPWAAADRMAWGDSPIPSGPPFDGEPLASVAAARRPVALASQLVHGDLTGNVLVSDEAAPGIIDFSPYFRPAEYALAVVVADAVVWHGADVDLAARLLHRPDGAQCLIRAMIFRHATALLLGRPPPSDDAVLRYERLAGAAVAKS